MLRLLLLRHAKSASGDPSLKDIDRPLATRGWKNAAAMGSAMVAADLVPDRILCSPARRTRETLTALFTGLPRDVPVSIEPNLYEPDDDDYLPTIAAEGGDTPNLLIVGHNPTIQETALTLAGSGDDGLLAALAEKFPTAALAVIEFDTAAGWNAIRPGDGRLVRFLSPRDVIGGTPDD